jgi:hypothetical protein
MRRRCLGWTLGLIATLTAHSVVLAIDPRFWGAGELGYGRLALASDQADSSQGRFSLAFKLGVVISHTVRAGVMLGGWTIESTDLQDPREGAGVSEAFAVAQLYPMRTRELFVLLGGGYVATWNNEPKGLEGNGWGGSVGLGCDFRLTEHVAAYPVLSYDRGRLGDGLAFDAVTLRVGLAHR